MLIPLILISLAVVLRTSNSDLKSHLHSPSRLLVEIYDSIIHTYAAKANAMIAGYFLVCCAFMKSNKIFDMISISIWRI